MVQGDGAPKCNLPHRAVPMPKRCRHVRTTGKGQTGAPCPIEMAATDSIPPGFELGGGKDRKKPELKTTNTPCLLWKYPDVVFMYPSAPLRM